MPEPRASDPLSPPLLRVSGLTKVYETAAGAVRALHGVDMIIRLGETLVLLGPSGSGKSTLLNILGGLDRATEGAALFHDRDLVKASDSALTRYRRGSVGFISQFFNLAASLTARENVELIAEIAEVLSGLAEGDRVVEYPSDQVTDGVRVRARG